MERFFLKVGLFLIFCCYGAYAPFTHQQLKATCKLVRNMCQPKNKATDEDIDKMHQGDWNVDKTAMCYMHCVLASNKLINSNNEFDVEISLSLAKEKLPEDIRDPNIAVIQQCKGSAKTLNDKCIAAWEISKCLYESNPKIYFLP